MNCRKVCVLSSFGVKYSIDINHVYLVQCVWNSSELSLLIFCLDDLSIGDNGVFRSPTVTVLASICVLRPIRVIFNVESCPCVWCTYVKD
jgi:hypothetical protein